MRFRNQLLAAACILSVACQREPVTASTGHATETAETRVAATKPSVVVILLDDARADLMTRRFLPRTWARIADSGTVFTRGYANTPLCCPSRSTLLTGLYQHNHGVLSNFLVDGGGARVFRDQTTIATALSGNGYVTALMGKYLNEYDSLTPWPYVPPGWTEWRAFTTPGYYGYRLVERGWAGGPAVERAYGSGPGDYSTSVLTRLAVSFIRSVPDTVPVLLLLTPWAPHSPATAATQDAGTCAGLPLLRPPSYDEQVVSDQPTFVRKRRPGTPSQRLNADTLRLAMCESLRAVDRMVDSVVSALARTGRLANTYVVVTSDNGFHFGEHRLFNRKQTLFEESVHVPFAIRGPGVARRIDRTHFVQMADVAPTILDWAGQPLAMKTDGQSWRPILANPLAPWRSEVLVENLSPHLADETADGLRDAQWSYHEYRNGDRALYDMKADPYQMTNLAAQQQHAGTIAALSARLAVLRAR